MSDEESSKEDDYVSVPFTPPLSGSEEEAMDAERAQPSESKAKDKGVIQSEVFETQRLINGNPAPSAVKRRTQRWGYFIQSYSARKPDGKVYVKVDGADQVTSNALFNDESEHKFKTQAHMLSVKKEDVTPDNVDDDIKSKLIETTSQSERAYPFMDWQVIKEVASRFPDTLLAITQDAFPEAKSTATHADVAKELLNLRARFDVTKAKQVDAQLNKYVTTLQKRKLTDLNERQLSPLTCASGAL